MGRPQTSFDSRTRAQRDGMSRASGRRLAVRYLIVGGSGYIGTAVQDVLVKRGAEVWVISRSGRAVPGAHGVARDVVRDDVADLMGGMDGVLNLVGIIREQPASGVTYQALHVSVTKKVGSAAAAAEVPRFVQMSALGASAAGGSRYFETKWEAEVWLRNRMPTATVVRPSLVFGGHAEFFATLAGLIRQPVVPVPGDGHALFDPVYRNDVATLLAALLAASPDDPDACGQVYEVGGPVRMSLDGLIDWMAEVHGRSFPVPKVHIPMRLMRSMVRWGEHISTFPLTSDQLRMLAIANITDDVRWHRWVPNPTPPGQDW